MEIKCFLKDVYAKVGQHCLGDTGGKLILQAKTQKLEGGHYFLNNITMDVRPRHLLSLCPK